MGGLRHHAAPPWSTPAYASEASTSTSTSTSATARTAVIGIVVGLALGKPLGIFLASYAAVSLGAAALPSGVRWRGVRLVGLVGGVGFTMSIFMAGLAFSDDGRLQAAKLAVLVGSALAASAAWLFGRSGALALKVGTATDYEAEASDER